MLNKSTALSSGLKHDEQIPLTNPPHIDISG